MIISAENLNFSYEKTPLFKNLNMEINKGDFVAFVGDNGSGKSTLIKLIIKSKCGYSGMLSLFDQDLNKFKDYQRVGYVSQKSNSFNPKFPATVKEVILSMSKNKNELKEILELVGMSGFENRLIGQLSGGQQQRVFIARALIDKPELLLLDEPTVGIDQHNTEEITALLGKLNKTLGITILMTTHNFPEVQDYINKILWLKNDGTTKMYDAKNLTEEEICEIYGHPTPLHRHLHKECSL